MRPTIYIFIYICCCGNRLGCPLGHHKGLGSLSTFFSPIRLRGGVPGCTSIFPLVSCPIYLYYTIVDIKIKIPFIFQIMIERVKIVLMKVLNIHKLYELI